MGLCILTTSILKNSEEIERQISEENRLVDYNDEVEMIDEVPEKQSDLSRNSSQIWRQGQWSHQKWKNKQNSANKLLQDSSSEINDNNMSKQKENEVYELVEDEKELENYITAKSSEINKKEGIQVYNQNKQPFEKAKTGPKDSNQERDELGMESLDLIE